MTVGHSVVTVAHIVSGPLDTFIELGLPLLVFVFLYWWSTRKRKDGRPK